MASAALASPSLLYSMKAKELEAPTSSTPRMVPQKPNTERSCGRDSGAWRSGCVRVHFEWAVDGDRGGLLRGCRHKAGGLRNAKVPC